MEKPSEPEPEGAPPVPSGVYVQWAHSRPAGRNWIKDKKGRDVDRILSVSHTRPDGVEDDEGGEDAYDSEDAEESEDVADFTKSTSMVIEYTSYRNRGTAVHTTYLPDIRGEADASGKATCVICVQETCSSCGQGTTSDFAYWVQATLEAAITEAEGCFGDRHLPCSFCDDMDPTHERLTRLAEDGCCAACPLEKCTSKICVSARALLAVLDSWETGCYEQFRKELRSQGHSGFDDEYGISLHTVAIAE